MIRARGQKGNTPVYMFGLSEENVKLLKQGKPIVVDLKEMGAVGEVVIFYGKTETDMMRDMQKAGMIQTGGLN